MATPATVAKYIIQKPISQGGMGAVYQAFDPELERLVAVKVLRDDMDSDEFRERFVREARAVAGLRHSHIVTIHDFGLHDGQPYLVMEFIPGDTLADIIDRRTPIPFAHRLQMIEELCAAVAHAHRMQIVHRDIKPGNVMLDPEGVIKVLDFGIAHTPASALTKEGVVLGTLSYMAPEVLRGGPVDYRSDIFAVGAVLYELMTFERAFASDVNGDAILKILHEDPPPVGLFHSDVDADLSAIVKHALAKDPERRYQDLAVMRADLARLRERVERSQLESTEPGPALHRSMTATTEAVDSGSRLATVADAKTLTTVVRLHRRLGLRGYASLAIVLGSVSAWLPGRPGISDDALPAIPSVLEVSPRPTFDMTPSAAAASRGVPPPPSGTQSADQERRTALGGTVDRRSVSGAEVVAPRADAATSAFQPAGQLTVDSPQETEVSAAARPEKERITSDTPEAIVSNGPLEATVARRELPSGPTDAQLIEQTLQKYASAMSARDADALSRVVVMDAVTRGRQQTELDKYDSLSMKLRVLRGPEIVDGTATVRCSTEENVGMYGRSRRARTSKVDITLLKSDGQWMVRDVHELR